MGLHPRLGACLLLLLSTTLVASGPVAPQAEALHREAIVIDTHIDTPQRLLDEGFDLLGRDPYGHADLPRMKEGGLDAGFMSIWVDMRRYHGPDATKRALQLIDAVQQQAARHPDNLRLATTAADIRQAQAEGKVALLMGMEGATPLDDDLGLLRVFHNLGIRYLTLTHSLRNSLSDSSTDDPAHNGLSDFGREVVQEMNRLGMMVDISHVSDKAFFDVLEIAQAPVIASHSSCRALTDIPRNMSDDQLRALAGNGGVVQIAFGCWFVTPGYDAAFKENRGPFYVERAKINRQYGDDPTRATAEKHKLGTTLMERLPRGTVENIADHIDHAVKVAGIDHVGLGSDFDGVFCLPEGMDDVSYLPHLTQTLLDRGYTEEDIKKILGGNTLRLMEEVEAAARRLQARSANLAASGGIR